MSAKDIFEYGAILAVALWALWIAGKRAIGPTEALREIRDQIIPSGKLGNDQKPLFEKIDRMHGTVIVLEQRLSHVDERLLHHDKRFDHADEERATQSRLLQEIDDKLDTAQRATDSALSSARLLSSRVPARRRTK